MRVDESAAGASDTNVMVPAFEAQELVAVEADEKGTEAEAGDEVRVDEPAAGVSDTDVMVPAFKVQEPVAVEDDEKETEAEADDEVRADEAAAGRFGHGCDGSCFRSTGAGRGGSRREGH